MPNGSRMRGADRPRLRLGTRAVRGLSEPIQNFLVAAYHPELLARNPFLRSRVRLHRFFHPLQRIDLALERIDLSEQALLPRTLLQQVPGTKLATLERKQDAASDGDNCHDPPNRESACCLHNP